MKFLLLNGLLGLTVLGLAATRGARAALWWGWPLGMLLMPAKFRLHLPGGLSFTPQITTLLALGALALTGSLGAPAGARFAPADLVLITLVASQLLTDQISGTAGTLTPAQTLITWALPYLLGRLYLRSERDLVPALRPLALALLVLVLGLVFEAVTNANPFSAAVGMNYHGTVRSGLCRARGTLAHPIFMGMVVVTYLPLALAAARLGRDRLGPAWWRALPPALLLGTLATVSRGPMLAFAGTLATCLFINRPRLRIPVAAATLAAAALAIFAPSAVKSALYAISGEDTAATDKEHRIIELNGREVVYTGTDHRWMLYEVYAQELADAGLLGFGNVQTADMLDPDQNRTWFYSIDNFYILHQIRYGEVGLWTIRLLILATLIPLARAAWRAPAGPLTVAAGGLIGAVAMYAFIFFTVALTIDYQTHWAFLSGLAISVAQILRARAPARAPARTAPAPTIRARAAGRPIPYPPPS
jgi:hypothetical protein